MAGNGVRPKSSTGVVPLNADRSSDTGWANRERFATTRISSSSVRRMKASTFRLSGCSSSKDPRPKARCCFRSAMSRRIQPRSDCGLASWASTLIAS